MFCMYSKMVHMGFKKVNKGEWRMPRLLEAMKDVVSCEK